MDTSKAVATPMSKRWLVRLLFAVLLFFGSEILLWTNPTGRDIFEWLLLIGGYLILSTLLLDIMRRFNLRDLVGLTILAGIYGLLNGLVINPESTLFELPRTLVTRVTGAHSLVGLEMIFLFLALTAGHIRYLRRLMFAGAVAIGLAWGTWIRWTPEFANVGYDSVSLEMMLTIGIAGIGAILIITVWVYRSVRSIYPDDMLLSVREWAVITPAFGILLFIRIVQQNVDATGLILITILLFLCMTILWFRRNTEHTIILAYHLPIIPRDALTIFLSIAILLWSGIFAYSLPLFGNTDLNQHVVVVIGFNLYGIGWLPAVSLFIGARTYIRQIQSKPL